MSLGARGVSRVGTPRRAPCHLLRTGGTGLWAVVERARQQERGENWSISEIPVKILHCRHDRMVALSRSVRAGINASIVGENPTGLGLYSVNLIRELDRIRDDLIVYTSRPEAFGGLRARIGRAPAGAGLPRALQAHAVVSVDS